jgi:outer membrane biosynthesis protein TonB
MPLLPPSPEQDNEVRDEAPLPTSPAGSRYSGLDHSDLVHLLDEIDDERTRARFREAVYIAFICWLLFLALIYWGPHYLNFAPHVIVADEPKEHHDMTILNVPPDLRQKIAKPRPTPNIAERNQESQSPTPSPAPAMPKQGNPAPPAPQPQQQPAPQPQQQAQQQPQQQQRQQPPPPHPQQTPLPDMPAPSPTKPSFNTGNLSAGRAIEQAARNARASSGDSGSYGNGPQKAGGIQAGAQILSDTQGVDFARYVERLRQEVERNWGPLVPEECRSPLFKSGITGIRFTIEKDGRISAMHLDFSTHDDAINRSAWGAITSVGQAAPLPTEFHGPNLELRFTFLMNNPPGAR